MDAQKQIKKLMEERGWTDYRLAKESGLSHSTVTNMFNRNNAPTLPTLVSAPVIKCKKTPRKKCSFVAEVK